MTKVFTVRLPGDQVAQLEKLALFDGVAIAEEIRQAVARHAKERANDPEFRQKVREAYEEARALLEELGGSEAISNALGDPNDLVPAPRRVAAEATS